MAATSAAGSATVSVVSECCSELGEGPHWDEQSRTLIWVDILGNSVHVLNPETGKVYSAKILMKRWRVYENPKVTDIFLLPIFAH